MMVPIGLLTLALLCVVGAIVWITFLGGSGALLAIVGGAMASAAVKQM